MRLAVLFLFLAETLHAEPPTRDPYGDLLPEGAITRIGSLRNSRDEAREVVITPDGTRLVTGSDQSLIVRDSNTLAEIRTIPLLGKGQNCRIAISADGKRVAAVLGWPLERDGSHRKLAVVWDVASGKQLCEIELRENIPGGHALALSSDGKKMAALGRLIDVDANKVEREIRFSRDRKLEFVVDDRYLLDNGAREWYCWETASGNGVNGDTGLPIVLERTRFFSRDGKSVFFIEGGELVRMNAEFPTPDRPTLKLTLPRKFPIGESVELLQVATNGNRCLLRNTDKKGQPSLLLFDLDAGKVIEELATVTDTYCRVRASTVSEKEARVVVQPGKEELPFADLAILEMPGQKNVTAERGLKFLEGDLDWMPNGNRLRSGKQLWDGRSGKYLGPAQPKDLPPERWNPPATAEAEAWEMIYSTAGLAVRLPRKKLDPRGGNGIEYLDLEVWDPQRKRMLNKLVGGEPAQFNTINARGLSRDGGVYVQDDRHEFFVWDTRSGRLLARDKAERQPLDLHYLLPTISPSGRQFVCAPGGRLLLFDIPSRTVAVDLKLDLPTNEWLPDFDWSPDGRFVAVITREDELRIYDLHAAKLIWKGPTTQKGVRRVRFSPDGRSILTQNKLYGLVWPVPVVEPFFKPFKEAEFADAWKTLRSRSAAECREACLRFAVSGDAAVRFIEGKCEPDPGLSLEKFDRLLGSLRSESFRKREAAEKELFNPDEATLPRLKQILETGSPDADLTRRIQRLIESAKGTVPTYPSDTLRELRGIAVLESIGSGAARKKLERLAKGVEGSPVTQEAQATLKRME